MNDPETKRWLYHPRPIHRGVPCTSFGSILFYSERRFLELGLSWGSQRVGYRNPSPTSTEDLYLSQITHRVPSGPESLDLSVTDREDPLSDESEGSVGPPALLSEPGFRFGRPKTHTRTDIQTSRLPFLKDHELTRQSGKTSLFHAYGVPLRPTTALWED